MHCLHLEFRLFEMLALYNDIILVLQMEPIGALTAMNLLLASSDPPVPYNAVIQCAVLGSQMIYPLIVFLFNHKMRTKIRFEFW